MAESNKPYIDEEGQIHNAPQMKKEEINEPIHSSPSSNSGSDKNEKILSAIIIFVAAIIGGLLSLPKTEVGIIVTVIVAFSFAFAAYKDF